MQQSGCLNHADFRERRSNLFVWLIWLSWLIKYWFPTRPTRSVSLGLEEVDVANSSICWWIWQLPRQAFPCIFPYTLSWFWKPIEFAKLLFLEMHGYMMSEKWMLRSLVYPLCMTVYLRILFLGNQVMQDEENVLFVVLFPHLFPFTASVSQVAHGHFGSFHIICGSLETVWIMQEFHLSWRRGAGLGWADCQGLWVSMPDW